MIFGMMTRATWVFRLDWNESKKKAYRCPSDKLSDLDAARDFEREINLERTNELP
jgi:hypothetical protein